MCDSGGGLDNNFQANRLGSARRGLDRCYERVNSVIVTKVNNQEIHEIGDLSNALASPIDGIHRIEFDDFPSLIFVDADLAGQINKQLEERIRQVQRLK